MYIIQHSSPLDSPLYFVSIFWDPSRKKRFGKRCSLLEISLRNQFVRVRLCNFPSENLAERSFWPRGCNPGSSYVKQKTATPGQEKVKHL